MSTAAARDPQQRLLAHQACEWLFHQFTACIDAGRATEAIGTFADECVLEVSGTTYAGREAVLGFLRARQRATGRQTRHLCCNFVLGELTDESADAHALMVVFAGDDQGLASSTPEFVTDCHLTFANQGEAGWLVTSRRHARFAARTVDGLLPEAT